MKFDKVVNNIDSNLALQAEKKLSKVFYELSTSPTNDFRDYKTITNANGETEEGYSGIGGDPFIFSMFCQISQVATLNLPTAATDGRRYYWNPRFILSKSMLGLRMICSHEAWHTIYMHPDRRGGRNPKLWNIAVDYLVNWSILSDLASRNLPNPEKLFEEHLGKFWSIAKLTDMIKNPEQMFGKVTPFQTPKVKLPHPMSEAPLTKEQQDFLNTHEKRDVYFYADANIPEELQSAEKLYDYFMDLLPKCPSCGKVGMFKNPNSQSSPGDCSDGVDFFGLGDMVDEHMDSEETEEDIAKRLSEAKDLVRRFAGKMPAGIEDELQDLVAPTISWKDYIRLKLMKSHQGHDRTDWTRFKTRPMFCGLMIPKRKTYQGKFACLLDCSGSMSPDDITYGVSQLAGLDTRAEGVVVPADAEIYWDKMTKLKKATKEELKNIKVVGRGGTMFASFFEDYREHCGDADFLVVITDGYLCSSDVESMKDPGVEVIWIITNETAFDPPFGKTFNLG